LAVYRSAFCVVVLAIIVEVLVKVVLFIVRVVEARQVVLLE